MDEVRRIRLLDDITTWQTRLLQDGLVEIPVDGDIAIRANSLKNFHADRADVDLVDYH